MAAEKITWEQVGVTKGNTLLSPAFKSNGHVFTSGSVGANEDGSFSDDVSVQTELAIKALETVLIQSGSSLDKVLKVLLFISNPSDSAAVNAVYAKYFPNAPARSCVVVAFPNSAIKVELECVAEYA